MNISDLKPRPSDFERCPVLSGMIIIFMKNGNEEGIRKIFILKKIKKIFRCKKIPHEIIRN